MDNFTPLPGYNTIPWIISAVAVLALLLYASLPGRCSPQAFRPFLGRNFAHRGLHTGYTEDQPDTRSNTAVAIPENSMAAFRAAVQGGFGIELDIQLSADGQVVVFHDDDLERVCGAPDRVDSYTYAQLRQFRLLGSREGIPLFTYVLEQVDGKAPIIIELKRGPNNEQLCRAAYDILQSYKGSYCIQSFDPFIVRWFRKNAPGVVRGLLSAPPRELDSGISGCLLGWGLTQFLCRPQFISYKAVPRPVLIRFAQLFCYRAVWTVTPALNRRALQRYNDILIFEGYRPAPRFGPRQ